ncbi:MAG: SDR family NAD(P)-dependent oxidoreductase [Pseudomonadota bacterium]
MDSFKDKATVITGAASGVGKALAERLGREGAPVLISDIEQDSLDTAVSELKDKGIDIEGMRVDVTERDDVFALADKAFEKFGKVHCVFNNAGVGAGGGALNWLVPEKAFRWGFDVNFYGPLYGIQAFVPRMLEQNEEGIISATSSGAGIVYPPSSVGYSCTKAALTTLFETLSHQFTQMSAKLRAALLFPGPHVINSNLMNSQRNLQDKYDDPIVRQGSGINDMESFQKTMKMFIGHEVPLTEPEEFADIAHDLLLDGKFWVMPMEQITKDAIRLRFEEMLSQTNPSIPKML